MQIRGEAAIACGFMAGLANGGCCSMDVSTATSIDSAILIFREAGLGKRHRLVKRRMRPSSPAAWLLQKPR